MSGPNFIGLLSGPRYEVVASGALVGGLLCVLSLQAKRALTRASNPLVPDERLSLRNCAELVALFIKNLGEMVLGKEGKKYFPFVGSLFIYVFLSNALGLIPGFSMPTDYVPFNLGLALTVFVLYNYWGVRDVGLLNYLKHMCGPLWIIAPLFFVIELVSHCFRPISLSLRLFGNMTGDHLALGIFTDLTKSSFIPIPVIFYFLGLFVCFMQAFVFTLLTMVYIQLATAHEEEH